MKTKSIKFLIFFCFIFSFICPFYGWATHLMGGGLTYSYVSYNSATQTATYDVEITMYRRCDAGSSNFSFTLNLGAYIEDTSNVNKVLFSSTVVGLVVTNFVVLPSSAGCTFNPNICIEKGVYSTTINLPFQAQGFYLLADQCCRNTQILNIDAATNNVGINYFAYVPPSNINNSSPAFVDESVPYLCVNDTTSLLNSVIDPDGDVLTYSFVTPFEGISNGMANPFSPNLYPFPIPNVTYNPNFSVAQPFGAGGFAALDGATGLTHFSPPGIGFYVVSVEIREFRGSNPNPIGIIRRDIQIIAITCPQNISPNQAIDVDSNSVISTYNINAGDSICFEIGFNDPSDSLYLSASGDIFNNTSVNPPATFSGNSGLLNVSSQFCWNSSITQVGSYQFFVKAYDNGCPGKTTNAVYTINVSSNSPSAINGAATVCANQSNVTYSVPQTSGFTYTWTISGGIITTGQGTNSITVNWGSTAFGNISYHENQDTTIISLPVSIDSFITGTPSLIYGADSISSCTNQLGIEYRIDTIANATTYNWTLPPFASIIGNADSNVVLVNYSPYSTSGNITVAGSNACGTGALSNLAINFKPIPVTEICRATVDSASQKTLLEWQKPIETYVNGYVIYREISGTFIKIDTIPNTVFSSYLDLGSFPNLQSEKYKIAVLDSCGNIGNISASLTHTTINLYGSLQQGGITKLYWNEYLGISDPLRSYSVLRDSVGTGSFTDTLAKNMAPNPFMNFTVVSSGHPLSRYIVEMLYSNSCTPGFRTMTGINKTRSNISSKASLFDSSGVGLIATTKQVYDLHVYPNPAKNSLNIDLQGESQNCIFDLVDLVGQTLIEKKWKTSSGKTSIQFDISHIDSGVYFILLKTPYKTYSRKIIKE